MSISVSSRIQSLEDMACQRNMGSCRSAVSGASSRCSRQSMASSTSRMGRDSVISVASVASAVSVAKKARESSHRVSTASKHVAPNHLGRTSAQKSVILARDAESMTREAIRERAKAFRDEAVGAFQRAGQDKAKHNAKKDIIHRTLLQKVTEEFFRMTAGLFRKRVQGVIFARRFLRKEEREEAIQEEEAKEEL